MVTLLDSKVAIVTGAAQGIGRAIAETLAEHGANVVVADIRSADAEAVAQGIISNSDRQAMALHLDVTDRASVERMVESAVASFGRVDILVNNAGILRPHLIIDFPEEDWDAIFAVNVKGVFLCSQAVARQMIKQGTGGSIINISSASGKKADREESAYCASKSAVIGFTRCLALELGQYGIRANGICPGATDTQMLRDLCAAVPGLFDELKDKTVLGRIAQPQDQANVVVFLASDLAGHITGESLIVSGGELMGQ
jgi:NAD(P)-dependent dehydrogenase (short-subunit alcohol dehydrogenase family)